jgi:hypothetical protein
MHGARLSEPEDPRRVRRVISLLLPVALLWACAPEPAGPVRFGLIADVQYADKDTRGTRRYRSSLDKLSAAVRDLNGCQLAFVAQLGDVIDGRDTLADSRADLDAVLARFAALEPPLLHVVGNHCLSLPRVELFERLGIVSGNAVRSVGGWRFLTVDTMGLGLQGVSGEDPAHALARAWLDAHEGLPNAQLWNGGLGAEQRAWLDAQLGTADALGQRAVVFAHHPVCAEAADPALLAWDAEEVLAVLDAHASVFAWINGHHHAGGYAVRGGVHHWTLAAMLDAPEGSNAFAVVEAWPGRLVVAGRGDVASRVLE